MTGRRLLGSRAQRLLAREQAAATWGQAVAGTAHTLAAYFHGRLRTVALDGEITVTLPLVPAGRDARAAEGQGEPLRDADPGWCADHKTAVERTQPIPPEAREVAIAASSPVPLWQAPFATATPDGEDTVPTDTRALADRGPDTADAHTAAGIPVGITAGLRAGPVIRINPNPAA